MLFFKIEKTPGISNTPVTLCGDAKTSTNSRCYQYSAKPASPLADSTFRTPFFCCFCTIRMCSFSTAFSSRLHLRCVRNPGKWAGESVVASTCWFCRGPHIVPQHPWLAASPQPVSSYPEHWTLVSSSCTCAHVHLPTRKHTHGHIIKFTNPYNTEQKTETVAQRSLGGGLTCGRERTTSL